MTTADWRKLCSRMADELDHYRQLLADDRREVHRVALEARVALAEPVTEVAGPSLGEVSDWITKCGQNPEENRWTRRVDHHDALAIAKAALYDWGRPAPLQPEPEVVGPSKEQCQ